MTDAERKDRWISGIVQRIRDVCEVDDRGSSENYLLDFVSPKMINDGPASFCAEYDEAFDRWEKQPTGENHRAVVAVLKQIDKYWQDAPKE